MPAKSIRNRAIVALIVAGVFAFANPSAGAQTGSVRVAVTSKSLIFAPLFVVLAPGRREVIRCVSRHS